VLSVISTSFAWGDSMLPAARPQAIRHIADRIPYFAVRLIRTAAVPRWRVRTDDCGIRIAAFGLRDRR